MAAPRQSERGRLISGVLQEAFAPLMRSNPAAFREKFRKMARDPHAFYRGSACLFFPDVTGQPDPYAGRIGVAAT